MWDTPIDNALPGRMANSHLCYQQAKVLRIHWERSLRANFTGTSFCTKWSIFFYSYNKCHETTLWVSSMSMWCCTVDKIAQLRTWSLIQHVIYSPGLNPSSVIVLWHSSQCQKSHNRPQLTQYYFWQRKELWGNDLTAEWPNHFFLEMAFERRYLNKPSQRFLYQVLRIDIDS